MSEILNDIVSQVDHKCREEDEKGEVKRPDQEPVKNRNDESTVRAAKRSLPSSPSASASASASAFQQFDDYATSFYSVKWIEMNGIKTPILMQNENGPCPLISICNCLLLRGHLKLEPTGLELIENDKLIQMLANLLLNEFVPRYLARESQSGTSENELNLEQNISDALGIFESLQYGLNVNVRFNSCASFEYTREMDIFDLFSIALYHGWIIDPDQTEFHRFLLLTFHFCQTIIFECLMNYYC